MNRRGGLIAVLVAGIIAVTAAVTRPAPEQRETFYVFGTLVEIVIRGVRQGPAQAAMAEVGQILQDRHNAWHAWQPGPLMAINTALAMGRTAPVDPALAEVLRQGQALACASGDLFNPAIGALIGLWGFHADTPPSGAPPSKASIARLRAADPRMSDLRIGDDWIGSKNPAVALDLGAFAKGAALDQAARVLSEHGIDNAVLNAGGDVNVIGRHGARPWRVAIRDPFVWGAVAAVSLAPGEVLYTSGNYERYFEHNNLRFAHIIDPRSGYPVQDVVSVSVLAKNGALADAAATALSVAGRADWPQVARDMGVSQVLIITGDGTMQASPQMRARLEPVQGQFPADIQVVTLPDKVRRVCPDIGRDPTG